jgi:hypothetical protein
MPETEVGKRHDEVGESKMALTLELPPPVGEELTQEARREGVSETDRAALFVCLATALLQEEKLTPFQDAVKLFLVHRSIDAERVASVIDELVNVCLEAPTGRGKTAAALRVAIHTMPQWDPWRK